MSVINKVLRDLDRQSGQDAGSSAPDLRRGTSSVDMMAGSPRPTERPSARIWVFGVMLGVPVLLAAWFWMDSLRPATPAAAAPSLPPSGVATAITIGAGQAYGLSARGRVQ